MRKKSSDIAFFSLCVALALVLAYVEALLQPLFPTLPGIKMGLPNIITVFLLYRKGPIPALCVSLLRIFLACLLFGNALSLIYSLVGGILSVTAMIILKRSHLLSEIGVSVAGGVLHNLGQILTAMLLLQTVQLGYYMIVLTITGTIAGILVGLCGSILVKKIPKGLFN